jgi:hypothetical protein
VIGRYAWLQGHKGVDLASRPHSIDGPLPVPDIEVAALVEGEARGSPEAIRKGDDLSVELLAVNLPLMGARDIKGPGGIEGQACGIDDLARDRLQFPLG